MLFLVIFAILVRSTTFMGTQFDTGYISINNQNDHMFYWYFPNNDSKDLIIWLSGGPGCASDLAVLFENGPFLFSTDKPIKNEYSWNHLANMVYFDFPCGAGFSYSDKE